MTVYKIVLLCVPTHKCFTDYFIKTVWNQGYKSYSHMGMLGGKIIRQ